MVTYKSKEIVTIILKRSQLKEEGRYSMIADENVRSFTFSLLNDRIYLTTKGNRY